FGFRTSFGMENSGIGSLFWLGTAAWAEAKDVVHLENDGTAFVVGEFAFGIVQGLKCGARFGAGVAIFLEQHGFFAGPAESVEEAGESGGIATELLIECAA